MENERGAAVAVGRSTAGAVVVPRRLAHAARKTVQKAGWLKKGRNVTPYHGSATDSGEPQARVGNEGLAVHVNSAGAAVLAQSVASSANPAKAAMDEGSLPADLATLLRDRTAVFLDNYRPGMQLYRPSGEAGTEVAAWGGSNREEMTGDEVSRDEPGGFRYVELFAGIGGFRVGLDALGGRCVFASELDTEAQTIYAANFPHELLVGDITEVNVDEVPEHDLLTAGFCCQSFSRAGAEGGLDDPRGQLFFEVVRIAAHLRPAALLLENVANLLEHDGGATIATITAELEGLGYRLSQRVINSSALLPQHRQRLYIVGLRTDLVDAAAAEGAPPFQWPRLPLLARCLGDVLEGEEGGGVAEAALSDHQWSKIRESSIFHEDPGRRAAMREGHARTLMSSYKRGYYMHSEFVFPAGWSGKGSGSIEPPRFFTPRECARLQGFPETFKLEGVLPRNSGRLYHHLGNAVAPPVIAAIAARLLSALNMTHVGGRPLPRGGARGEQERERQLLKPSLDIVLAASPPNEQLKAQIAAFLSSSTESDGLVPTHSGYSNDVEEGGGVAEIAALLSSREGRAQMAALRDVARLAHGSKAGRARASRNCAVMAAYPGLVERILEIATTRGDTPGASDRPAIKRLRNEDDTPRDHGNDDRPETSLEQNRSPCEHAHAGRERATSDGTGAAKDAPRMRRMHEEVQRLALVALTNLAADVEACGAALRAANVRHALTRAFVDENEGCVGGVVARLPKNLREQASVALELLQSGVVDEA